MPVRRFLTAIAVPLLLVGALAACAPEVDAQVEPKLPTPSATSPTPATPVRESPEAFIRRWQSEADEMVRTGDAQTFRSLSKGCSPCANYADRVVEAHEAGASVEFDGSRVLAVDVRNGGVVTAVVTVNSTRLVFRFPDGRVEDYPRARQKYRMTLAKRADNWVMSHYAVL